LVFFFSFFLAEANSKAAALKRLELERLVAARTQRLNSLALHAEIKNLQ
jgi:hypothetical protein